MNQKQLATVALAKLLIDYSEAIQVCEEGIKAGINLKEQLERHKEGFYNTCVNLYRALDMARPIGDLVVTEEGLKVA
jgi:hypothetical protein